MLAVFEAKADEQTSDEETETDEAFPRISEAYAFLFIEEAPTMPTWAYEKGRLINCYG